MGLLVNSQFTQPAGFAAAPVGANSSGGLLPTTDAMISAATKTGSSYPVQLPMPSWLSTDAGSNIGELQDQYNTAPQSILDAANKSGRKINRSAQQQFGQNLRQAGNATSQIIASQRQQGATVDTSGIVKGQMVEDAQKQKQDSKVQVAQMQQQAKESAASLSTQIASTMGQLRQSYLGTLAGTYASLRGQDTQYSEFSAEQASRDRQLAAQTTTANTAGASNNRSNISGASFTSALGSGSGIGIGGYSGPPQQQYFGLNTNSPWGG